MAPLFSDFNLDSEGHCFLCLNKISVKLKPLLEATPRFPTCSVHNLARYLEMDMGKVLIEEGERDLTLRTKVRKSRLKVELCEKCNNLNTTFSGLYGQLEKLELEINSSLELIQGELLAADAERRDKQENKFRVDTSMRNELSQIVDVLREEAIQKCTRKLRISPRVRIAKLTKKEINDAELSRHQTNFEIHEDEMEAEIYPEKSVGFPGSIKREFEGAVPNEDLISDSEDDIRKYDMDNEPMNHEYADTTNDQRVNVDENIYGNDTEINKHSLVVASPSAITIERGKHCIHLGTGKWKCSVCPLELTTHAGIQHHYNSVHRKIRYKCVPCGKEFSHRHHYNRHHQSVHVGVRFKCLVCNKLFSYKHHLTAHQRKPGCMKEAG